MGNTGWYKQKQFRMSPEDEALIGALVIKRNEVNHSELIRNLLHEEAIRHSLSISDAQQIVNENPSRKMTRAKGTKLRTRDGSYGRHIQKRERLPSFIRKPKSAIEWPQIDWYCIYRHRDGNYSMSPDEKSDVSDGRILIKRFAAVGLEQAEMMFEKIRLADVINLKG